MAWWTVVIFSASSSGISISNSSSRAITSSTVSRESAPRSSTNEASLVTCSCFTPSCSATMALTCCSTVLISGWSLYSLLKRGSPAVRAARPPAGAVLYGTPPGAANRVPGLRVIVFTGETGDPVMRFGSRLGSPCGVRPTASLARGHRALAHVHAAIDVQRLAGDVGRLGGDEEQHRARHLNGRPEAAHRDLLEERTALLLADRARHVGVDQARSHRVHRDAARGELLRERAGESQKSRFRGGVVRLSRVARYAHHGSEVDDPAVALLHHAPHAGLGHPEDAREVRGDDRVPVLRLHAQQQLVAGDGGVVDEYRRQLARALELRHQGVNGCGAAGVEHGAAAVASVRREVLPELRRAFGAGGGADHAGAGGPEGQRDRVPYAARGARDECDFFLKHGNPPGLRSAPLRSRRDRRAPESSSSGAARCGG